MAEEEKEKYREKLPKIEGLVCGHTLKPDGPILRYTGYLLVFLFCLNMIKESPKWND